MSAGTGIMHSEFNMGKRPCHLFQIWFSPNRKGHPPSYETVKGVLRKNCLIPLASGKPVSGKKRSKSSKASLKANAEVFLLELSPQKAIVLPFSDYFLYCFSGKFSLGADAVLSSGDQARARGEPGKTLRGISGKPMCAIISFF